MVKFDNEKEIIEIIIAIYKKTGIVPKDIPKNLSKEAKKMLNEAINK